MANGTWKIARGKGTRAAPAGHCCGPGRCLVLLGKAQSSLFDRARAEFSDWTAPALEAVRAPLDGVSRWLGGIGDIFVVYQENLRLKQENARLRQWQSAALLLEGRVKRYRLLLNAVPDPALTSVTAHVIGRATRPFLDTMILDAGKSQGVHPGQAVVDPRGMIGRVFLAGERTSWVILLTDLNSRIPVRVVSGNVQAIMAGDNTPSPVLETISQPGQGACRRPGRDLRRWRLAAAGSAGRCPGQGCRWVPRRAAGRSRRQRGCAHRRLQAAARNPAGRHARRPAGRRARQAAGNAGRHTVGHALGHTGHARPEQAGSVRRRRAGPIRGPPPAMGWRRHPPSPRRPPPPRRRTPPASSRGRRWSVWGSRPVA